MKKIYIGLSAPTGKFEPFASIIKAVESRPYDHAYVRFPEPMQGNFMIFQASSSMVNLYNKDLWLKKNKSLKEYEIEITDDQYASLWLFIQQSLGIPYSLIEDFGILLMKIFHLNYQPFNKGGSAEFCSKLAATVCKMVGVSIPVDVSIIDPTLLDQILEKNGLPSVANPKF